MRLRILCGAGALLLVGAAIALPVERILDFGASRYHTVAGFRADFRDSLQFLRWALALNGLIAASIPWVLHRCRGTERFSDTKPERLPMIVLFLLTAFLIAPGMSGSFQQDEWRCLLEYVRHGPWVILTRSSSDNHVLYSLLQWPFVSVLGAREIPVRLPALLLSSLAAPILFAILRRRHGPWISFGASVPLAVSFFLAYWGAEGRAYGPLIAFILALCWLRPRMLRGSTLAWAGYVALGTLAVWLHPFAAAAIAALTASGLLLAENRRGVPLARNLSSLLLVGGASFLLWAFHLPGILGYAGRGRIPTPPPAAVPALCAWNFTGILSPWWALPFSAAFLLGLARGKERTDLPVAAAICALVLAAGLQFSNGDHAPRFYAPALALLWVAVGHGLATAFSWRPGGAALLSVLLLSSAAANARYYRLGKRDARAAAAEIRARSRTGERIAVFHDMRPMGAYLTPAPPVESEAALRASPPDWFVGVDSNLNQSPTLLAWLARNYSLEFRLPSIIGEVRGYRLASPGM